MLNTGRMRDQWHTMTRTGLSPRLSTPHRRAVRGDPSRRCRAPAAGAGHAGARRDARTAPRSCAFWSIGASSRARCSCRSTGRPRTARRAASARWCSRRPIRSPASPRPRRRRPRIAPLAVDTLRLPAVAPAAAAGRARLLGAARDHASGTSSTSRSTRRPTAGRAWLRAALPEGDRITFARRRRRHLPRRRAAGGTARGGAVRRAEPEAAVAGLAEVAVRRCRHPAPASGARCWPAARSRARSTRGRSCACASRSAPSASRPRRPRATAAWRRSAAQLGAGTNCGSCIPEIRRLIARQGGRCVSLPDTAAVRRAIAHARAPAPHGAAGDAAAVLRARRPARRRRRRQRGGGLEGRAAVGGGRDRRGVGPRPCAEMEALAADPPGGSVVLDQRSAWTPQCSRRRRAGRRRRRRTRRRPRASVAAARAAGVPVNVIDKPTFCTFQFGAIVNRSPLVIGISTGGAAPVFGQAIRSRIEALLPAGFARWAARGAGAGAASSGRLTSGCRAPALLGALRRRWRCARRTARPAAADREALLDRRAGRDAAMRRRGPRHAGRRRSGRSGAADAARRCARCARPMSSCSTTWWRPRFSISPAARPSACWSARPATAPPASRTTSMR